jgi:hypothetical protein
MLEIKERSLNGIICINLEVHLWSGRKRVRKEDLISKNREFANLPPESLASLGTIRLCDPEDLAPFLQKKREAEKLLSINGLPVLGTMGIPESKLSAVYKELIRIQGEFEELRNGFYQRFEDAIGQWRQQGSNAEWSNLFRDLPSPEDVAGRLSFGFHMQRATAPGGEADEEWNQLYAQQMTGLKGELFRDAAAEAKVLITKYLTGADAHGVVQKKEKVTWKTLRPLKRIAEKFRSFAFLDPSCEPLARLVEHLLGTLPTQGPIEGMELVNIWTLAQALGNPSKASQMADMAFAAPTEADAFDHLLTQHGPVPLPVATPVMQEPAQNETIDLSEASEPEIVQEAVATPVTATTGPSHFEPIECVPTPSEDSAEPQAGYLHVQEQPVYVGLF